MRIRITAKDKGKASFLINKKDLSKFKKKYPDLEIINLINAKQ